MRRWIPTVLLAHGLLYGAPVQAQYFVSGGRFGHPCVVARTVAAVDAAGNLYIAGHVCASADFDPGPGTYFLGANSADPFVSKLDSAGNFLWAGAMSNTTNPENDAAFGMALDSTGNVYTVGRFASTTDFDPGPDTAYLTPLTGGYTDGFISKLSSTGSFVWAKQISGTQYDEPQSIAVDPTGNLLIAGEFSNTSDLDPGPGTATITALGFYDVFVSKLDSAGNFVWGRRMGGTGFDLSYGMAVDGSGNVVTVGHFEGTADFDPGVGQFNLTSAGGYDVFVSKLDSDGNFVWARRIGGAANSYPIAVALGADGSVHVVGEFSGTVDFDPGAGVFELTASGSSDGFVFKLGAAGDFLWAKQLGGPGSGSETARSVAVGAGGNVHVVGDFDGTVNFFPGPASFPLTTKGGRDAFVSILDSAGTVQWLGQLGGNCSGTPCEGFVAGDTLGYGVAVGLDGSTYTVGQYRGRMDFDPGFATVELDSQGLGDSNFVSRLSAAAIAGGVPDGGGAPGVPLTARRISSSTIRLSWGESCGPAPIDYEIYEGQLGNFTSHVPYSCTTEGATSIDIGVSPGNRYYLVVPVRDGFEGSYGTNSAGVELAPSALACTPQTISSCAR
jgi:hypothetical protein